MSLELKDIESARKTVTHVERWCDLLEFHIQRGTGKPTRADGRLQTVEWPSTILLTAISSRLNQNEMVSPNTLDSWRNGRTLPRGARRAALFKTFWPIMSGSVRIEYQKAADALALATAEKRRDRRLSKIPRHKINRTTVIPVEPTTDDLISRGLSFFDSTSSLLNNSIDRLQMHDLLKGYSIKEILGLRNVYNNLYHFRERYNVNGLCTTIEMLFYRYIKTLPYGFPFRHFDFTPQMVKIPKGSFLMGAPDDDVDAYANEKPQHFVSIKSSIAVGRYPITFDEFAYYCNSYNRPLPFDEGWGQGKRPVIHVSWNEAVEYCNWLSDMTKSEYRLLSEGEWEYSARAGTYSRFRAHDEFQQSLGNCSEIFGRTTNVDNFTENSFGLSDMLGNVWEWVTDCWEPNYLGAPDHGSPRVNNGNLRCLRGGAWDCPIRNMRITDRCRQGADNRINNVGFRVAVNLST